MPSLSFTVQPSTVGQLHDILACLVKFDENISLEASSNSVRLQFRSLLHPLILLASYLLSQLIQICACLLYLECSLFFCEVQISGRPNLQQPYSQRDVGLYSAEQGVLSVHGVLVHC